MFYFEKELNKLKKQFPKLEKVIDNFKLELVEVYNKNPEKATQLFIYFFLRNFFCGIKSPLLKENILKLGYYRMIETEKLKGTYNFFGITKPPLEILILELIKLNGPLHKAFINDNIIEKLKKLLAKYKKQQINKKTYEDIHKFFLLKKFPHLNIYNFDKEKYRKIIFSQKNVDEYVSKTINHYEKFFGNIDNHKPQIFLTTSGMEANNIIAYFFKELFGENFIERVYSLGWYLEKEIDIPKDFLPETQILFIENLWKRLKIDEVKKEVQFFIKQAENNPNKNFYLVWDKTGLLDKENKEFIEKIPKNLKVLITSSLTKFQKGETNFFFGIIATYNLNSKELHTLQKAYKYVGFFNQSYLSKIFFPRVKKTYVKEYFENIEKNKESFKKGLGKTAKDLILLENRIGFFVEKIPKKLIKELFVQQDSFGFPYTNISPTRFFSIKGNLTPVNRISFGTSLEADLEEKARKIAKYYKKNKRLFGNIVF